MITLDLLLSKPDLHTNTIFVLRHPDDLPAGLVNTEEAGYIRRSLEDKNTTTVEINRYDYVWYFVFPADVAGESLQLEKARKTGDILVKEISRLKVPEITVYNHSADAEWCMALAEGMTLGGYQFLKYKTDRDEKLIRLNTIKIWSEGLNNRQIMMKNRLNEAVYMCRDFVNEPVINLSATQLAEGISELLSTTGIKTEIFNKKKIESLKMGGLLAVNRGSSEPPTFTVLEWKPENAVNENPVILVGKGVTFDTGGMNIKTGSFMDHMKTDMTGAATMASVIYAAAATRLPVYVIALLPATDNRINSDAVVSGDVIEMHSGKTVEILNTDAEGRLILADALSYAQNYNPMLVITAATLTGSAARAIGRFGIVAMQAKASEQMQLLKECGEDVYERIAEFPFWDEYAELIKSDIADLKNVGPLEGGAITAGKFLEAFTNYPFIHLDIAGTSYAEKRDSYRNQGATGTGVRLLFSFLAKVAGKA